MRTGWCSTPRWCEGWRTTRARCSRPSTAKVCSEPSAAAAATISSCPPSVRALSPQLSSRLPPPQQRPAPTPKPWWHTVASAWMLAARCGAVPCVQLAPPCGLTAQVGVAWERAGGADQPMVGFGFGDAVIVELLKERGLMPQLSASVQDVVIALGGPDMQVAATSVAAQLRAQVQNRWLLFQLRRFAAALHGLGPVRLLLGCHSLTAVPHAAGALRGSSDRVQEDEVGVQACGALGRRSPGTHQSARPDRVGGQPPRSQPAEQQPG
jgi:hypothetical protein